MYTIIYNLFTMQNDLYPVLIYNEQKDTKLDIHEPYPKLIAEVISKSTQISIKALILRLLLLLLLHNGKPMLSKFLSGA